jgi:uncharacterized protein (TIGR02118 family)
MIKLTMLIRRKNGMTREQFRDYYENNHIPLAEAHTPYLVSYKRNFIVDQFAGVDQFDCITEFWFDVEGDYAQMRGKLFPPNVMQMMAEDEANFIDRSKSQLFLIEENASPPENLLGNRAKADKSD